MLFSTHYHKLTEDFETNPLVGLFYLNCFVDPDK